MRNLLPLCALLASLASAPVHANEDDAAALLEVSRAGVLASPGTPKALEPFLPRAAPFERLHWPLPEGPLVVLGLPGTDPVARLLADAFQLAAGPEDLRGGYGIWAWHDGRRPLVLVLGADPAALYAARFEFDAQAPAGASNPDARSLDFAQPNEEAGLVVRAGTRRARPRFALRAWAPGGPLPEDAATLAAGARVNRLWLDSAVVPLDRLEAEVRGARSQGVTPGLVLHWSVRPDPAPEHHQRLVDLRLRELLAQPAVRGIRHFVLVFETPLPDLRRLEGRNGIHEARVAALLARGLRDRGLDELVVVPRCHSDDLARAFGPPPGLRDIPEAWIAWSGPLEHCVEITSEHARRRVRDADVPVVLLDTWAAPFQGESAAAHVPCAPYGRAADLHEVLEGVIVVGARHVEASLDSAWGPASEERFGAELLAPLLPAGDLGANAFLAGSAAALEGQAQEDQGVVGWMGPLAQALRAAAAEVAAGRPAVAVPVVPAGVRLDGRIDEPSWAYARALPLRAPGVRVLVLSDGRRLAFALRTRETAGGLRLAVRVPETGETWRYDMADGTPDAAAWNHARRAARGTGDGRAAEIRLDRFALFGEAIPTRRFEVAVFRDAERLWPPPASPADYGLLVVTR